MKNEISRPTDLEIRFQEAVLTECDRIGADSNNLHDADWEQCFDQLNERNFGNLVIEAARFAAF